VAVADNTRPSVTNTAAVYGGGSGVVTTANDRATVRQLPALAISSYPSAGGVPYAPFTPGRGANVYHVTVANDGYAATSGRVSFTADLPPGLTAVSISAPPGWSCSAPAATCVKGSAVSLAAGEQDQITIDVAVAPDAPLSAQTFFQASGGGQIPPAGLDTNNDYSVVTNGGEFTDPTYITPGY
jgi:hypothetical protein